MLGVHDSSVILVFILVFPLFLVTCFMPGLQLFTFSPALPVSSPPRGRSLLYLFEDCGHIVVIIMQLYFCRRWGKFSCRSLFVFFRNLRGISEECPSARLWAELLLWCDSVGLCQVAVNASRPVDPLYGFRGIFLMETWWCIWREFRKGFWMETRLKPALYLNQCRSFSRWAKPFHISSGC